MTHEQRNLMQRLHDAGVILTVDGEHLRYRAPTGALTPELRAALADAKPDLIHEYHERAGILEYDARMPRAEAEHRAAAMVFAGPGALRPWRGGQATGSGTGVTIVAKDSPHNAGTTGKE